jgi:hypothetical protein
MPAEAIHLSALKDSTLGSAAEALMQKHERETRLGAIFVDLPYFDRFALGVLRYVLKRPVTSSPWGAAFHTERPVALGKALLREAAALRADRATRPEGDRLLALSLGYFSHLAVDTAIHPLVNRLARERARRLSDRPERQHTEVEKFQSILFHEQRLGFDFMGRSELSDYIGVEAGALLQAPLLLRAITRAVQDTLDRTLTPLLLRRWLRGYRQYAWLISGPAGKTILPAAAKEAVREESYEQCRFPTHFAAGVERSRRYLDGALAFHEAPRDPAVETALDTVAPEGPIDDPSGVDVAPDPLPSSGSFR